MNTRQGGSTTVEFALVFLLFLMFLLGILDFSRMLYTWQSANAATRTGARYAVVCASPGNNAQILARMKQVMPEIAAINVVWEPAGCNASSCEGVTVSVTGVNFKWISPIPNAAAQPLIMALPNLPTYLPREMMNYNALIC